MKISIFWGNFEHFKIISVTHKWIGWPNISSAYMQRQSKLHLANRMTFSKGKNSWMIFFLKHKSYFLSNDIFMLLNYSSMELLKKIKSVLHKQKQSMVIRFKWIFLFPESLRFFFFLFFLTLFLTLLPSNKRQIYKLKCRNDFKTKFFMRPLFPLSRFKWKTTNLYKCIN